MLILFKHLKKLPVYTKSGIFLGRVAGMELETESHLVRTYFVRKAFLGSELAISRTQVLSITSEKIIVLDSAVKESGTEEEKISVRQEAVPISMSKMEN